MKISKSEYEWLLGKINTLERENNVLKSALYKACEHLSEFNHFMYENGYENVENWNKDEWKDELMKDEI